MPRRNNQSAQSNASRRNDAGMSHNSDKDLKCHDTTLGELQTMFSTSLDPEVVQLILTESNYNVDDAIERLLILSDANQGWKKDQLSQRPDILSQSGDLHTFSSSLPGTKREKSPLSVEVMRPTSLTCEQDWGCFGSSKSSAAMVSMNSDYSSPVKTESLHFSPFVLSFGNPAAFTKYAMENSGEQTTVKSDFCEKGRNQCINIEAKNCCSKAQNPQICAPNSLVASSGVLNPGNSQVVQCNAPTRVYGDGKNILISESSGLPEFPDTISQQYKELSKENQGHINVENTTSQELSNTDNYKTTEIANPFTGQNGFSLPSFGGPGEIKQEKCHEFKESLENTTMQGTMDGIVSENWSSTGGTNSGQSWSYLETDTNRWLSPGTSAVNPAYSTQQLQNRPRTSSNYLPLAMSTQSLSYTASGQNNQTMFPVHDFSGFNCSTGNGSQNLFPLQNISPPCNLLSKGPIFHSPAVQRQCQPPMYQGKGYIKQDTSTLQPRWRFSPSMPTPWQQAPANLDVPWSGPRARGNAPHRYPHRSSQQPHLQFGRGRPPGPYRFPTNAPPGFMSAKRDRRLILMRGLPGSGKSTLAQKLKGGRGIVLSTDDFFMKNQRYEFDLALLGEAHEWNQKRARKALEDQIAPIIIDNTNSQIWEMKPYVSMAIRHNYYVKFVEPDVWWKWNIRELARRNHHGVDITSIKKMKERYEHNVTVDKVLNSARNVNDNTGGSKGDTGKKTGSNRAQFGELELESSQVNIPAIPEKRIAERNLIVQEALQDADRNNIFVVEEENKKDLKSVETDLNQSMQSTRQSVLNQEHDPSPKPQRVRKSRDTRSRYIHQNLKVECKTIHKECRETGENGDTVSGNDLAAGFVDSDIECPEVLRCSSSSESREVSSLFRQDRIAEASCDSDSAECCQSDGHCLDNGGVGAEHCLETDNGGFNEEASFLNKCSCNVALSPCFNTNTSIPLPRFENDTKKVSDDCEDNAVKEKDPYENLCVLESKSFPPPLSSILATAARSKRGLSSSFSVQKQSTATAETAERCEEERGKLPVEAVGVEEFTQPPITAVEAEVHIEHHTSGTRAEEHLQFCASATDLEGHDEYVVESSEAENEMKYQTSTQGENGHIEPSATHIEVEVHDDHPAIVSEPNKECKQTSGKMSEACINGPVSSIETEVRNDNSVSVSEAENENEYLTSAKETEGHIELPSASVQTEVHEDHIAISEAEKQYEHQDLAIKGKGHAHVPATGIESDVYEVHATAISEAEEHCEHLASIEWPKRHADLPASFIESDVYEDRTTAISEIEEQCEDLASVNWATRHANLPSSCLESNVYKEHTTAVSETEEQCEDLPSVKWVITPADLPASSMESHVYKDHTSAISETEEQCEDLASVKWTTRLADLPSSCIESNVYDHHTTPISETEEQCEDLRSVKWAIRHADLPSSCLESDVYKDHTTVISETEEQCEDLPSVKWTIRHADLPSSCIESNVYDHHTTPISETEEQCEDLASVKWPIRHADLPPSCIESDVYEEHTTAISKADEQCEDLPSVKWGNRHTGLSAAAMKADIHEDAAVSEAEEQCDHQTSAKEIGGHIKRREEHSSAFPVTIIEARNPRDQEKLEQSLLENSFEPVEEASVKSKIVKENNFVGSSTQSESASLENMSRLEFLVACFPDLSRDHLNSLLSINNGNVIKVVDDLVSSANDLGADRQPSFKGVSIITQESLVVGDTLEFPIQKNPVLGPLPQTSAASGQIHKPRADTFSASSTQAQSSSETAFVTVNAPHQSDQRQEKEKGAVRGCSAFVKHCDFNQATSGLEINSPLTRPQLCTPSDTGTFQLTLEPAVGFHLIEMFGPIAGLNLGEDIDHQDLIVDVDSNFARQLYKKWEKTVQARKGISTSKVGSSNFGSPRSRILTIGNDTRDPRGAAVQSTTKKLSSPFRSPEQQTGTLREIMDEQLALELSRSENLPDASEQDMATTLKRQKLYAMFPGVDPQALDEVFEVNRHKLEPTVKAVKASCNLSAQQIPRNVFSRESSSQDAAYDGLSSQETEEDWSWLNSFDPQFKQNSWKESFQALESPQYSDYRAETVQHAKQRDECFKKAALAFSKKQGQLAQFYAQQGHLHTEKIKEANARAAALILDRKNEKLDDNTVDLHGLHVSEAIEVLEKLLNEKKDPSSIQSRKGCKFLSVVTGRGSHSRGGKARIKPAVLEYLKKYNYRYTEPHPGLVKVFL